MSTSNTPVPERSPRIDSSRLVILAYESAWAGELWTSWFDQFRRSFDGTLAMLVIRGFGPTRYVSFAASQPRFETQPPADAFPSRALAHRNFAIGYIGGEIVEDWAHVASHDGPAVSLELFVRDGVQLTSAARALGRELLPHLRRSLAIYFEIENTRFERDVLQGCFDELGVGCAVVDRNGNVSHANRAAREALSSGQAGVHLRDGELRGKTRGDDTAVQAALRATVSGRSRAIRSVTLRHGSSVWFRSVAKDRALALMTRGDMPRLLAPEMLASAFALTPAESRVASLFALGHAVPAIALQLGVTESTVRQHLKKVQAKTGTHRQATLVRRLLETIPNVRP